MGLGLQIWERCCLADRDVEAAGMGQAGGSARAEGEVAVPKVCICLPGEVQKKSLKCCIMESGSPAVRLGDDKWIDLGVCSKELQARSAARGDLSMLSPPTDFSGFQMQALCLMEPVRVWSRVCEDSLLPGFCLSPISGSLPDCSFPCARCRHSWNKVGFTGDGYARVATFFLEKKSCLGPELFRRKPSWKYFKCDEASSKLLPEVPRGPCHCAYLQPGAVRCCGRNQKCLPYRYFEDLQMKEPSEPLGFPFISSS